MLRVFCITLVVAKRIRLLVGVMNNFFVVVMFVVDVFIVVVVIVLFLYYHFFCFVGLFFAVLLFLLATYQWNIRFSLLRKHPWSFFLQFRQPSIFLSFLFNPCPDPIFLQWHFRCHRYHFYLLGFGSVESFWIRRKARKARGVPEFYCYSSCPGRLEYLWMG